MPESEIDDNRRRTIAGLAALTSTCLAGCFQSAGAAGLAADIHSKIRRTDELSGMLRGATISVEEWRNGLDSVFGDIALEDVLRELDFEALAARTGYASLGVKTVRVKLPNGIAKPVSFVPRFFAIGAGRAIIPHGHRGMVSAHLVLKGGLRLRQYDTLNITEDHLELRPTVDRHAEAGDLSSIGLLQDNAHWFIAEENSHTLDTIVTGLGDDTAPAYEIFNVDMNRAEPTSAGRLRAPRLDVQAALSKYG